MQIPDARSAVRRSPPDCLMATLGLDLGTIDGGGGSEIFEAIKRRCASCEFREVCELALSQARVDLALSVG